MSPVTGSESSTPAFWRIIGWGMLLIGASVFLIRLHHAGPYGFPAAGNLRAGVLSLLIGTWLVRPWLGARRFAKPLGWLALAAAPIVMFFALYATLAELEEVVVLKATHASGAKADLRLWIVDRDDGAWVTMPRWKSESHGLAGARVDLLRHGEFTCVTPALHDDNAMANEVHRLRDEKYAVQRFAKAIGAFPASAGPDTVALRLDPCPDA